MATLFEKLASSLLDLSLKNRALNFKDEKLRSIELIEPDPDKIFDLVKNGENGKKIYLVPSAKENDKQQNKKEELPKKEIGDSKSKYNQEELFGSNKVKVYKQNEKSENILKSIKKINDSAFVEKGINVLYLAFGFLKWIEVDFSKSELKSPLLLIKVTLDYDKSLGIYSISNNDNEIIVNPTLKTKLKNDFDIDIPIFDEKTDTFKSYLSKYNKILVDHKWSIDNRIYLGIFSFAKLSMYQDLKNNNDSMSNQELIQVIFNGKIMDKVDRNYDSDYYDEYFKKGKEIYLHNVFDADSSQIKAINEAKTGRSFVIQGPPGTGKSRTITNIIAELLHDGKKVLFVSEKLAALNVVFNNLEIVGLCDYCLKIHSDKTNKKDFVQELYRVMKNPPHGNKKRQEKLQKLKRYKKELDSYCEALSKNIPVINKKPYDILCECAKYEYKGCTSTFFKIQNVSDKSNEYLVEQQEILDKFASYKGDVSTNYWESPWYGFLGNLYVYGKDEEIKKDLEFVRDFTKNITSLIDELSQNIKLEVGSLEDVKALQQLLKTLVAVPVDDIALLTKDKAREIDRSLHLLFDSKTNLNKYLDKSIKWFIKDIYKLDIFDLHKKFNGKYYSFFGRWFNRRYKQDSKLLLSFKKPEISKINFHIMKDAINQAYMYLTTKKDIDKSYTKLKELSGFDYSSFSPIQINETLQKFKVYKDILTNDIIYNKNFDFEVVRNSASSLLRILNNSTDLVKFSSLQKYFDNSVIDLNKSSLINICSKMEKCLKKFEDIKDWSSFYDLYKQLSDYNLHEFVKCSISKGIALDKLKDVYTYAFYKEWLMYIDQNEHVLTHFKRTNHDHAIRNFCSIDKELLKLSSDEIKESIASNIKKFISNQDYMNNKYQEEVRLIERQANKKRGIKSIRHMFEETPNLIHVVKPCLLMSPISVATYLSYDNESFDTLIFDEASQIFPWDAIGAIARSKQVIVVGDSKQMPPTNFFQTLNDSYEEDYDTEEENASDYESILDLCSACLPSTYLNWHYRSKSESLIAFSNHYLYNDKLVTFPSSKQDNKDFGLDFHYVKNGVFTNRKNLKEAEKVVDLIFDHFKTYPERSLGVVCFSINQQMLVEEVLDKRCKRNNSFAKFIDQNTNEPFFIKNLETVQGDERDTIIFSIGYGKDHSRILKHHFGPLNRKGGERRLNVAITRAKFNIKIVSSIRALDIDLNRTGAEGVRLLRKYLDVAENGIEVLNRDIVKDSNAQADSPFEEEVANVIRKAGYKIDLQVGCSGYKIDIGVKHPKVADYVLAVECDGATYHSSRNARDRDRLRQEVLENCGWKFYRIWSTEWFTNNKTEKEELIKAIKEAVLEYDKENSKKYLQS